MKTILCTFLAIFNSMLSIAQREFDFVKEGMIALPRYEITSKCLKNVIDLLFEHNVIKRDSFQNRNVSIVIMKKNENEYRIQMQINKGGINELGYAEGANGIFFVEDMPFLVSFIDGCFDEKIFKESFENEFIKCGKQTGLLCDYERLFVFALYTDDDICYQIKDL